MDIYFQDGYGKLYESIEGGTAEIFRFKTSNGEIKHQFIKRQIPTELTGGETLYDLITPYGYGGPLVVNSGEGQRVQLCQDFGRVFEQYCNDHKIVSEFVRFHPIVANAVDFAEIYHPVCIRHTLGTNLAAYEDPIQAEFSKGCRKSIRQVLRKGVTYRITRGPEEITAFPVIYQSTMDRDKASNFYYFDDAYFRNLLLTFRENILYVESVFEGKTIAAGLYLISDGTIHVHLSGTLREYLYLSPAYILRYAATLWGKEHGFKLIHHGGGTSNDLNNSLYQFKKQFAQNTEFEFYIGKKIWNPLKYQELCNCTRANAEETLFPAYRKGR